MKKITKNQSFAEILNNYPELLEVFLENGMHCFGCPMAQMENIEQGALAHGLDPDKFVQELNERIKKKK